MAFDANYTLSHSESVKGWTSFFSYYPEWIIGMNNYLYTFSGANLWRHNTNESRNTFYGISSYSYVNTIFNEVPLENKLFKTIALQSTDSWLVNAYTDVQAPPTADEFGEMNNFETEIEADWFEQKEGVWFAYLRFEELNPVTTTPSNIRSTGGIGGVTLANVNTVITSANLISLGGSAQFTTSPARYGNIISVGDNIYAKYTTGPDIGDEDYLGVVTNLLYRDNTSVFSTTLFLDIIEYDATLGATAPYSGNFYLYFSKNTQAESYGILGHYLNITLYSTGTEEEELFAIQSDVMKSFP